MPGEYVGVGAGDDESSKSKPARRVKKKTNKRDVIEGVAYPGRAGLGLVPTAMGLKYGQRATQDGGGGYKPAPPPKRRKLTPHELCFPKSLQQKRSFEGVGGTKY